MHRQSQKLNTIHFLIGNACNKRCAYCLQDEFALTKKADFDEFAPKMERLVEANGLETHSVHYWGGEPLLYRKTLYKSLTLFDRLFPTCSLHRVTTNGTLVDDDYVEFCNANPKIHTVVSIHDFDIPKENWVCIGKLKNASVTGVVTKQRPSPYSYYDDWKRACEYAGHPLHIGLYPIHANDGAGKETWLSIEDVDNFFRELLFVVLQRTDECEYSRAIISNFQHSYRKYCSWGLAPKCFNDSTLSIDMFGNQYVCHHNNAITNRIFNVFEDKKYIPLVEQRFDKYFASKECQECPALNSCMGGCYLTNTHEVECYWNKTLHAFETFIETQRKCNS